MSGKRKRWFHLSTRNHGDVWTAKLRPPVIMGRSEPDTPRLCVAGSLVACLSACYLDGDIFVYQTEPVKTNPPSDVPDSILTGERWVVPPVILNKLYVIPYVRTLRYIKLMREYCSGDSMSYKDRAKLIIYLASNPFEKVPSEHWCTNSLKRRAEICLEYFMKNNLDI